MKTAQVTAVIGAQWGDEGKGKLIDVLAENVDIVARACGGANAGHTIVVNGKKNVFRLLPSGSLHANATVLLGGGMVIHLPTLMEELELLSAQGIDLLPRLRIAAGAHIVFEHHKMLDAAMEEAAQVGKEGAIGTTKKGIGPAYMDKMLRRGVRIGELTSDAAKDRYLRHVELLQKAFNFRVDAEQEWNTAHAAMRTLSSCIVDGPCMLHDAIASHKNMLIEGAQATLLDIDHGTYPFVTSSATTAAGALQGLGLPPSCLQRCIAVAKVYCTRVGGGPFPAEAQEQAGNRLRDRGGEYGSVTKRPRRCGWVNLADLRHANSINGFTDLFLTKLDVLDTEETIPVCTDVDKKGDAIFDELPGWKSDTLGINSFEKLPKEAQNLCTTIAEGSGIPLLGVGTGPGREDVVFVK